MIYKYTEDNILSLLRCVYTIKKEQLLRFFADEQRVATVQYILDRLELDHDVTRDAEAETYSAIGAPEFDDQTLERRLFAFWPIAFMGSNNVQEIMTLRYPQQYLVIPPSGECFDFTVIDSEMDARIAGRLIAESMPRDGVDSTNHVAVLRRESDLDRLTETLRNCNFNTVCYLEKDTHKPVYNRLKPLSAYRRSTSETEDE